MTEGRTEASSMRAGPARTEQDFNRASTQPRSSELEVFNANLDICCKVLQILMIMKMLEGLEVLQGVDYRQDLKDIMILGP